MNGVSARTSNGVPPNGGTPAIPNAVQNSIQNGIPSGVSQGRPHPVQGMSNGAVVSCPLLPNAMAMKMIPQPRSGMSMQSSPDNARVIREASRLQEQQRILQSRQQQQPQPQPQQFQVHQQFAPQSSNGNPNNQAMLAALQAAGGIQSPSFHNAAGQIVSSASPRMSQPNLLSSSVIPTISSIQSQIQRSNPSMPAEQVAKIATERLHQIQQQRMSQAAMNAAAGTIGAVQANFQAHHDGNFSAATPTGMPNGGPGVQNSPAQGYSPMMRVVQPSSQGRISVANSPSMNGPTTSQSSRSATPQAQRNGSAQSSAVPGVNKSPRPPQAQVASS
jgi:chromatin modification-related protein VID21